MNVHYDLLLYLDKKNILSEVKTSCEKYLEELTDCMIAKFPPFRFLMEIDVIDLTNIIPDTGEWLMKNPFKFQRLCNEILYACLQSLNENNKAIMSAQIAANLRLKCVPGVIRPNQRNYTGLVFFHGLLLSISKPESYVFHTVWSCPEECEGNEVVLQYIPKVPPKCYVCKSILFENSGLRRCGEQVTAIFKLKNRLLSKNFQIVDDFVTKLKLGSTYNIYASVVKKDVKVMGLEEVINLSAPLTSPIPVDIKKLFNVCKGNPWQFICCLASSIGVNICPLHHFMHLKICLLISLASVKANRQTGAAIVHVLAAGYDTGYVGQLMEKGAELADRVVFLGTTNTTTPNAFIASSGGVCVMPLPLHTYNQKQILAVITSLETGEVSTDTIKVKLQSAVWAQGMDFKKTNILNVASVFGIICRGDYGEYNDEIADFLLENAVEPQETDKEEVQALQEVACYIDLVAGIDVNLDAKTELLLRSYFLAARRERPQGVTVVSMGALIAICLTSARLCRRAVANVNDAVFAIWLHVCGSPEPRFAPDEYLQTTADVKKFQNIMENFKDWLEQFTGSCIS